VILITKKIKVIKKRSLQWCEYRFKRGAREPTKGDFLYFIKMFFQIFAPDSKNRYSGANVRMFFGKTNIRIQKFLLSFAKVSIMLPAYNLVVDITAKDKAVSEKQFRAQVAPSLNYLGALKGALRPEPCSITYYSPNDEFCNSGHWSVRVVVLVSVGKNRGESLLDLYKAIARLVVLELPELDVQYEISQLNFS
jgi:hypothetical protein